MRARPSRDRGGRPIVVHVPHAARAVPPWGRRALLADEARLDAELLAMTDHHTDRLFGRALPGAPMVRAPASRLVVDVERFRDDAREPMAARGMGAIYLRDSHGRPLRRRPTAAERELLLAAFYDPHHARLARAVDRALSGHGRCLIIDAHSFPARPLPYERDRDPDRPEMCVGTDPFHTPAALRDGLVDALERQNFGVAVDRPFAGALVPARHHARDARVLAAMIEVRRDLYLDEATGEAAPGLGDVARRLGAAVSATWRAIGGGGWAG